ncbi:hypothetical protein WOLCODRAFT_104096 [Wolfiporia cocos MD-104 SS10]|uniref:EF-hand domain-containing protein n=1 Tax=Wolfiporia cocos (strain MD-104) TaxID=742152 RepID=A0A2H3JPE1_WOLCO|nr:hypothetical protein WOLCODRAFT_104096 [Wolfiporia cocos MD-104 SS10]
MIPETKPRDFAPYDPENAQGHQRTESGDVRPNHSRNNSWDLLGGIRHSYSEFDPRRASQAHLVFAEGDIPQNTFSRVYNYLLNVSIVTRWTLFILPVLGLLWIPGILSFTAYPDTTIWGVRLVWWSVWLTVVWCGWWGAKAFSMILPHVARHTIGVVSIGARHYIEWLRPLQIYITLFSWSLIIWVSFQPLINTRRIPHITNTGASALSTAAKILFAIFECAIILLAEKVLIQWIATKFHQRSYAERVADQKFAVRVLVALYRHSSNIPWRSDTLHDGGADAQAARKPKKLLKKAIQGVRFAATTTTTVLGNVASEIAGSSVLQPNSPQAMVKTALESANKSRMLARRLFYSFAKPGASGLILQDIARIFPTFEEAEAAFSLFDKDGNGDATRDEIEIACMECHREQLSIEHSMRDLDSAVGRLDALLMSVYVFAAALIVAVALEAELLTLATTAGTFILGLSWLISTSLGEVLISIIFLFVKHPYDVGDRVNIDSLDYTVKEIRLLSTVFLDANSTSVQAPHSLLNTKFIRNIRRSPLMSETFTFDVAYGTTFEQIQHLRELMLAFVKSERRDYLPSFDVSIVDMPAQEKLTLTADIKYKSNWQQGALTATRRNKWISALKEAMAKAKVFGPAGDPDAIPAPERRTVVPWEKVDEEDHKKLADIAKDKESTSGKDSQMPAQNWNLTDQEAVIMDDTPEIFGENASTTSFSTGPSRPSSTEPHRRSRGVPPMTMPSAAVSTPSPLAATGHAEEIEMKPSTQRSVSS